MACADGRVRLWDLRAGGVALESEPEKQGVSSFLKATLRFHKQWCSAVAWDPTSQYGLASACHAGRLGVWDLRSLGSPVHALRGSEEKALALAWLSNAAGIVCGGSDARVRVFRAGAE
uniref:Peroxin-7 n=2 Tax=Phaeomonas parva TaxID=124430 RepID=A0A7S1XNL4_9STRA|mmetsp:Transcript_19432/g.58729  ORF Transcript_19432/g.58729 Transcript_19432/m.58729 type:complete len:118 (+) Transcript_19432:222-575(+)